MGDPTRPADDIRNQPADQKLIDQQPGHMPPADSKGQPQPYGPQGSDAEKNGEAEARRQGLEPGTAGEAAEVPPARRRPGSAPSTSRR